MLVQALCRPLRTRAAGALAGTQRAYTPSGTDAQYLEGLHAQWRADPASVNASWQAYFADLEAGPAPALAGGAGGAGGAPRAAASSVALGTTPSTDDYMNLYQLVRAYQVRGHNLANLDPLGLFSADLDHSLPPELELSTYGWSEADFGKRFDLKAKSLTGVLGTDTPSLTLGEIVTRLKKTYCSTVGVEYMHIPNRQECNWIREKVESAQHEFSSAEKRQILDRLHFADKFETFLAYKFSTAKRFGVEGGESFVVGMKACIDKLSDQGVEHVVMGMAHRGRLNVLANVVRKDLEAIFKGFHPNPLANISDEDVEGTGDVKYHLGMSYTRSLSNQKTMSLSLVANPSHLEAVNPVVIGKTRAKAFYLGDRAYDRVAPILVHGDAAFAGQGIVYETLAMGGLYNYRVGGTIHMVINNQIGFTTDPRSSRSSPYCSDVAKAFGIPIFHVNGDDPEAVVRVCQLAAEWRQTFKRDVVVDIVCYRRHGHNEIDQPAFTQPLMYQAISKHPTTLKLYAEKLAAEGTVSAEQFKKDEKRVTQVFETAFQGAAEYTPRKSDWLESYWAGFKKPSQRSRIRPTGLPKETLLEIGKALYTLPEGFQVHRTIAKNLRDKEKMFATGEGFDWATAEALAFGSLAAEGNHVRLSGQDVERGTFSHRHAVLHDQKTDETHLLLSGVSPTQAKVKICNSNLSEFGILGFELGYSMENPNSLVCWEAQFGDFVNGAQVIIDQFISSGENKWLRQSGLVLLLPHGYDGAGPEHSSCRIERFLQSSDDNPLEIPSADSNVHQETNWQVCNLSTPANYYHCLRRQVHREFRKPLIIASPKNLLRMRLSNLDEFTESGEFKRIYPDNGTASEADAKRVVICTGKVYYELAAARDKLPNKNEIAIIRVEQLCPTPYDLLKPEIERFKNATDVVWCQEEPMNAGAYAYMAPRLETLLGGKIQYAGRAPSASPATGWAHVHVEQQRDLINEALGA